MSRGKSQIKGWVLAGAASALLLVFLLSYFLFARSGDPFRRLEKLDVLSYTDSTKSFQGGSYLVEGTIEESLYAKTGQGRLVSVAISSSKGIILVPILIPEVLGGFNLQKGQNLRFKVKGITRGLLQAEKIEKT